MRYQEFGPPPRLAAIVEKYWMLEGPASPEWECILPDGRAELIFHYGEPFARKSSRARTDLQPRTLLVGQITAPACLQPRGTVGVAAIRLRPEATGLFGPAAAEITDRFEPLEAIARTDAVVEQLAEAAGDLERIEILERFVTATLKGTPRPEVAFAIHCLVRRSGALSIDALSGITGVARRQLERRFQSDVGVSPKAFARLLRVNRAARLVLKGESLAEVAFSCGYFDQSHMSNDFRGLIQQSPNEWQRMAGRLGPLFVGST